MSMTASVMLLIPPGAAIALAVYFGTRIINKLDATAHKLDALIAANAREHAEMDGRIDTFAEGLRERTTAMQRQIDAIAASPFIGQQQQQKKVR